MSEVVTAQWRSVAPDREARPRLPLYLRLLKAFLSVVPSRFKPSIYSAWGRLGRYFYGFINYNVCRLPFGLALKVIRGASSVEADALRFVSNIRGMHTPHLIDYVSAKERSFLLTAWVEGEDVGEVWDDLTEVDRKNIVEDLRYQLGRVRLQARPSNSLLICNASGGPIKDPRIPWVSSGNPRTFASCQEFSLEVWPEGVDEDLTKDLQPIIERDDIPIVFSHGDILPKNLVLPKGLERWRVDGDPICILDWEYAGWMPYFWDPLKATWMECEVDDPWMIMMRDLFSDCRLELDMDWEWRSRSRITIL